MMDVITCPCWDLSQDMIVKRAPNDKLQLFMVKHHILLSFNTLFGLTTKKHQGFHVAVLVRKKHRRSVDSPHKRTVTRTLFGVDDVIMRFYRTLQDDLTYTGAHVKSHGGPSCSVVTLVDLGNQTTGMIRNYYISKSKHSNTKSWTL